MTVTISIDPGAISGAIAIFVGGELLDVLDMPCVTTSVQRRGKAVQVASVSPVLLAAEMREAALAGFDDRPTVIVEKVHAMPTDARSAAFGFGRTLGVIEGVTAALGWPIVWVTAPSWKRHFGLIGKDKDAARLVALERWPEHCATFRLKKHGGRADAALIGVYGAMGGAA